MEFKAELNKETGAYRIKNVSKDIYTKREFKTKEGADRMCVCYANLGKKDKDKVKAEPKEPTPKKKVIRRKKVAPEPETTE
jgi:hypothetical protein